MLAISLSCKESSGEFNGSKAYKAAYLIASAGRNEEILQVNVAGFPNNP